jgi:hypothetical protein
MDLDKFLTKYVKDSTQQRWFIHFTDKSNIPSIKTHGILSTREVRRLGMNVNFGGNQWSQDQDKATGMDGYVHLCFKTGHPMEKRAVDDGSIKQMVHLKVSPEIIRLPEVLLTDDVSNKGGVVTGKPADMLDKIDLDVLYTYMLWQGEILERLKKAEKCEILVPKVVLPEYIIEWPNG